MLDTESDGYYSDSDDGSEIADNIIPDDDTLWKPDSIVEEAPPPPLQTGSTSHHPQIASSIASSPSSPTPDPTNTNAGWQNAENNLQQPVFVEKYTSKYPNSHAGYPLPDIAPSATSFAQYGSKIANSDKNPYAPFANKINWDIAKRAKLRGPGSNSLAELLAIEGVSKHTFHSTLYFY